MLGFRKKDTLRSLIEDEIIGNEIQDIGLTDDDSRKVQGEVLNDINLDKNVGLVSGPGVVGLDVEIKPEHVYEVRKLIQGAIARVVGSA